jgi:uncharacterized protein YyaL (SSP411 family)
MAAYDVNQNGNAWTGSAHGFEGRSLLEFVGDLVQRSQDDATPSGNATSVTTPLKLAGFTNGLRYVDIAHQAPERMQGMMAQYPLGFGQ